jgi:hypothetical protein
MLRLLFDEPRRGGREPLTGGQYDEAIKLMRHYGDVLLADASGSEYADRPLRLAMWSRSLLSTLYELEQSVYCSGKFAERVKDAYVDQMNEHEYDDYMRHLYFFENGFVRVFSALDKLGSFLNDLYSLETEQIKERFSYFTVIRRMRERNVHPRLQRDLYNIKEKYKEPMQDLRLMRNHEIHGMNAELLDEFGRIRKCRKDQREEIENLHENTRKLEMGFVMVCKSLHAVFTYCRSGHGE